MDCEEYKRLSAKDDPSPEEDELCGQHLANCPSCMEEFERISCQFDLLEERALDYFGCPERGIPSQEESIQRALETFRAVRKGTK